MLLLHFVSHLGACNVTHIVFWGPSHVLGGIMYTIAKHLNSIPRLLEVHVSTGPVFAAICEALILLNHPRNLQHSETYLVLNCYFHKDILHYVVLSVHLLKEVKL